MNSGIVFIFRTFLIPLAIFPALAFSATLKINPRIEQFEKSLEAKVYEQTRTLLGEDAKIIATATAQEGKPYTEARGTTTEASDVLYVPGGASLEELAASREALAIRSVSVDVRIGGDYDESALANVRDVLSNTLKPLKPTVSVSALTVAKKEAGLPLGSWLPIAAALVIGVLLFFGTIIVALAMRTSTARLVEGLRQTFTLNHLNPGKVSANEKQLTLENKTTISAAQTPEAVHDYPRNLGIVKDAIKTHPRLVVQTLGTDDSDLRGMKWLIPSMSSDEQDALGGALGDARLKTIAHVRDTNTDNKTAWLQDFVERMALRKMRGGSTVEKALGDDRTMRLAHADPESILAAAQSLENANDPAAWRVLLEFIPKNQFDASLKQRGDSFLQILLASAKVDESALRKAADRLIATISDAASSIADRADTPADRLSFYSTTLLEPVLSSIISKKPGADDVFIDEIEANSNEFAALVRERIWTPRMLNRVPKEYLTRAFRALTNEERAAILASLPESYASLLQSLLPSRNMQTIVSDLANQIRARNNQTEQKEAGSTTRQFLERLRRAQSAHEFELLLDNPAQSEAA